MEKTSTVVEGGSRLNVKMIRIEENKGVINKKTNIQNLNIYKSIYLSNNQLTGA